MRPFIALAVCLACLSSHAQENATTTVTTPTSAQDSAPVAERARVLTFAQMGQADGVRLSGSSRFIELNSGIRLDELVTRASLSLKVLYPQGMRHDQSFIRVYVNNQLSGISQLNSNRAGVPHTMDIELDPVLFSDFASVRIEYDGTYDTECVDPNNPTLRFDIRPESTLSIVSTPLNLVNDLALLPAPFFDPRDNRKLRLPLVLPTEQTETSTKAAGVLASWMGAQAFYRQAEFDLIDSASPTRHTIILTTGQKMPEGMSATDIEGPTLMMANSAENPWIKHLYVMGRTDEELLQAVYGLVIEGQVLSGQKALVKKVDLGAPRKPYDAPRYVSTERPVRFGELIDFQGQLEVSSDKPRAAVSLRLPPDLFSWAGRNIPMDLKYRYTAPSKWNDSLLNIEINNSLIQSFRLAPRSEQVQNKININLLGQAELTSEESLQIPAFRVGGNNELAFSFGFMAEGGGNCTRVTQVARGSIDPESTLDFSDLPHYTRMPNLTAFANGGYPFTIMADLSDTVVVLPANPTPLEIKSYLNVMGLFGQWTGLPATRTSVLVTDSPENIGNKHWLALGTSDRLGWLNTAEMNLPMVLNSTERSMGLPPAFQWLKGLWQSDSELQPTEQARALIQTAGSLGAIMGFESHLADKKAGLVITGTDQDSFERAVAALSDYGDVAQIKGSVSLIRSDEIQSYSLGNTYISGALPWWLRLRIAFSEYPALIAVGGALAGVILAILAFGWLSSRASRRTKGG
ncbi:cellulose biosynthesis cyclic di-GMP-binding regulatory protein BcsB [Limnobacter parvus]|uniref:Cyclic di-GMP-binding protein n=1 Tax=Limnobacter parvus TaxID=2939690 RepID=A0ABT1XIJ4_9BURK|nr:cellulose biosynthesis cyclic di-GMP-binding regulatory protein BcsB [Limnobacter parvus]MCR2747103.1 cellulose biosynthesis cyclic di-GMP-binding regulatory protein BcsB [Limnobacter parvus]